MTPLDFPDLQRRLTTICDQRAYYVGGTLCIDYHSEFCVGLNLNGKGFVINDGKETALELPLELALMVRDIYREVKGREPYRPLEARR